MASQHQLAHRRSHQHNAPRRAIGEPPRWGASAIDDTFALTGGSTHAIGTTCISGKSRYGDLWAELERRRLGEDGRITIRRRNLDGDFGATDTTPVRQAARTPTSLVGSGDGCMVLAPHLRMVV
jgi:hypothetical protein